MPSPKESSTTASLKPADKVAKISQGMLPKPAHSDYRTPEYAVFDTIQRQVGIMSWARLSFGYNRNESDTEMLSPVALIHSFIDIVSKNGNLLINVSSKATAPSQPPKPSAC
jgi:alpha-L-fucosidase